MMTCGKSFPSLCVCIIFVKSGCILITVVYLYHYEPIYLQLLEFLINLIYGFDFFVQLVVCAVTVTLMLHSRFELVVSFKQAYTLLALKEKKRADIYIFFIGVR